MNKYIDALEYIENEEVLYEDVYNEDDVSFSKEILCEVEYLKEHFDTLHELINKCSKLEKALDKACELLEHFEAPTARVNKRSIEEWKEWLLDNDY